MILSGLQLTGRRLRPLLLVVAGIIAAAALAGRAREPRGADLQGGDLQVKGAASSFSSIAARAGLTFAYNNGHRGMATILEESGSGCAIFDYDGDGWPDLYLLNGRDLYGRGIRLRNALYHNNRDGTFTDVTESAGVPGTGYGIGVVAGDFDNDGHPDLYLCQWGKNVLYHNNGDGTFTDVTDTAHVGGLDYGEPFHTGAAWIDYDRDGRLDLFVCGYVKFRQDGLRYCQLSGGFQSNCPPQMYDGTSSILYHNNGDGTFTNVTRQAKLWSSSGKALSAITCDYNGDGWPDLFVGQDGEPARLLRNRGDGTFEDAAMREGVALAADGATMAAMGIDLGDYRNEGEPGLVIADFSKRPNHLWRHDRSGFFSDVSASSGIGGPTFDYLGFGAGFLDFDNDGWLDLFFANGHVYPEVAQTRGGEQYLQTNQLFHNEHDGTFREVTAAGGPAFRERHGGRGAAFGDLDNDGNLDVLVNNNDGYQEGHPSLLHNNGAPGRHFLSLRLVGTRSNRDAIGARVVLHAGALTQYREVRSGGSYLSSSDPRLHFGVPLAGGHAVDEPLQAEVRWPSGLKQQFGTLRRDRFYELREGVPEPRPQRIAPQPSQPPGAGR